MTADERALLQAVRQRSEDRRGIKPLWPEFDQTDNRHMVARFCDEQHAQGLIPRPLEPAAVFGPHRLSGADAPAATRRSV